MTGDTPQALNKGTVTVVIPCFNAEGTIEKALDSVFSQVFDHWTIVVVDDGSTDSSPEILREYAAHHTGLVRVVTSVNKGACHARNIGVSLASTEFVAFLDSDDTWNQEKLEQQTSYLEAHPNVVGVTSGFRKISRATGRLSRTLSFDWSQESLQEWALLGKKAPALNSTLVVRTAVFRSIGGFDERLVSFAEDLDLSWRLLREGPLHALPDCLVTLSISPAQNHRNGAGMADALRVFFTKVSSENPQLAMRAEKNLRIYEALSLVRAGKAVAGVSALLRCCLDSPRSVARFLALRLFGLGPRAIIGGGND